MRYAQFDLLLTNFPNSSHCPTRRIMNKGLVRLAGQENYTRRSLADFQNAVQKLSPSVDLAVAHFRLADTLFVREISRRR